MRAPKLLLVLVLGIESSALRANETGSVPPASLGPPVAPAGVLRPGAGAGGIVGRERDFLDGKPAPSRFPRGRAVGRAFERAVRTARGERTLELFRSLFVPAALLPPEYAPQAALILDCDDLPLSYPRVFLDVLHALEGRVPLVCMVSTVEAKQELAELLDSRGLTDDSIFILPVPHDTMWVRDYGPTVVRRRDGSSLVLDSAYGFGDRANDDAVPSRVASFLGAPVEGLPFVIEGGNIVHNGEGLFLATTRLLEDNADRRLHEAALRALFRLRLGCRELVLLEELEGEETGHADMFATFTSRDTVVVGAYDPEVDPKNAAILDRNAARLSRIETPRGQLNVVRIPMPPNDDGVWRTYVNVVYANGTLLVPAYPEKDPHGLQTALAILGTLLPSWDVVPIDAEDIAGLGGALHCLTLNLPSLGNALAAIRELDVQSFTALCWTIGVDEDEEELLEDVGELEVEDHEELFEGGVELEMEDDCAARPFREIRNRSRFGF